MASTSAAGWATKTTTTTTTTTSTTARVPRASSSRASSSRTRREISRALGNGGASSSASDDERARGVALVRALPTELTFIGFVERAFELDGEDAGRLVEAFCASERLTRAFCEDAFDAVYAAYARRASEEELSTLLALAKIFTSAFRERALTVEERVFDRTVGEARRGARGDVPRADAAERVRSILDRAFDADTVDERKYLAILRDYRVELDRDERRGASYAFEFLEADEALVAQLVDPSTELDASAACRRELIAACDLVFEIIAERDRSSTRPR